MEISQKALQLFSRNFNRSISLCKPSSKKKSITIDNMHQGIRNIELPLASPVLLRAAALEEELRKGATKAFTRLIRTNLPDCHSMGQKPITLLRQVLTLITYPEIMKDPQFPDDAKERARTILEGCTGGSIGSYTECTGMNIVRRHCAEYIERRDGIHSNWHNIILSTGSREAMRSILKLVSWKVDRKDPGVLIPTPEVPMYTSNLREFFIRPIRYYLDETKNWGISIEELNRACIESKNLCTPRAIVVVNPGNPTGQLLTLQNIQDIIKFASYRNLVILADEVYQENIYDEDSKFYSFKKVMTEMGPPYSEVELASFMSVSHSYTGESGLRCGYVEVVNLNPEVYKMYLNSLCIQSCPSVLGQAAIDCVVNPPREDEPSYIQFYMEKNEILSSFRKKARMCMNKLNFIEGISCNQIQGAFYAFPKVSLPEKALQAAQQEKKLPDVFYALEMLEHAGICVTPGSSFGQKPGTWHFRATILLPEDDLDQMLKSLNLFQSNFMKKYS